MRDAPHISGRFLILGKVLIVLIAFVLLGFFNGAIASLVNVYEDLAYSIDPSPQRASVYGERHFSSAHSIMYDINRAEHFYREIEKKDTTYPYLYFQLARIEFLKSRFNTAMIYINKQIELHGNDAPNAYYVRGLIEGYKGDYDAAAQDYGYYLKVNPDNWATANDYAWVLLKAKRNTEAAKVTGDAIEKFPNNAWLLSTRAIALYETGDFASALTTARKAKIAAANITEAQWLVAYPGNDPKVARTGITTLQKSIDENMHKVELAIASG